MPDTLFLDSEGLLMLYRKNRRMLAWVQAAKEDGVRVATTAMTTVEADYSKVHPARIAWTLSQVDVHGVTRELAAQAAALLREHGLSGHKYAIDAVLAASARSLRGLVTVVTSDPQDLALLCGPEIEIVKL
ncbi:DNA-binding protein [Nocardia zapadnayensis]|uniref:DNA-binding protein n=1 Tax=Nocardia rhamnosiphila TaxID=426716 RepID=UPI0022465523|nr:DNA-binding protein [Nocardia zapadnayensis]MCX0270649.1 DNA-binding protein [Nocardia zapadnayensis]